MGVPGPKNFFVIGGYTYSNPGDEAILKVTLRRLNRMRPGSRFVIWSDRRDFSVALPSEISHELFFHRCPGFFSENGPFNSFLLGLYRRAFPFASALARLAFDGSALAAKMKQCDYILFIGGGYLNSLYNLLQMHYLYCLARDSGRPIYLLGQTIGPFLRPSDRAIAEDICRGADRIVVREESSKIELARVSDKVLLGGDEALDLLENLSDKDGAACARFLSRKSPTQIILGLNLKSAGGAAIDYGPLVQSLNRFNREHARGELKVVFMPMEMSVYCDDREEGQRLARIENRDFEYAVVTEPLTVEDRLAAICRMDLFIGMRFHSLVFALSGSVPCLGIYEGDYYFRKLEGLLKMHGMEHYCLKTSELSGLDALLSELFRDRARIKTALQIKHTELIQRQQELYHRLFSQ